MHSCWAFTVNLPDRRGAKAVERCDSDEWLLDKGTTTTILGRTFHKARFGCYQKQKLGNEKGSEASWRFLWNALWPLSRNLWLFKAPLSVRVNYSAKLWILLRFFINSGPPGSYAMVSRMREMWPGNTDDQNDLLNLVQRNRMSLVSWKTFIHSKMIF